MNFPKLKKRYWLLIIIALLSIFVYFSSRKSAEELAQIEKNSYALVQIKSIENKQLISGRLNSSKEVNMKSELAGIIDALYVQVGDEVKKGQAIAKISILPDPKSTQDAQRQIEMAKINLEKVKSSYDRNKTLFEKDVISRQEYEISNQEYKSALAEMNAAHSYLKIVKQGFSKKSDFVSNVIYSTIDGIVLDVPVKVGASIQSRNNFSEGTTIATIADMNEFLFKGQVNEKDLKNLEINKPIDIQIAALKGEKFSGNISKIAPKGVDIAGITRFDIEAKLNIKPVDLYKIKSGFTATAEITIEVANNVLAIEEKYIQYSQDTAFVRIKKGENTERKIITTGISDGLFVEIKSGLKKGDMVSKEETKE